MYMHFWYAMHGQLWWCLVGVITIVQCIFGALFLGLGCNIFLVLRFWCYALSATLHRLATAVAHLLYRGVLDVEQCHVWCIEVTIVFRISNVVIGSMAGRQLQAQPICDPSYPPPSQTDQGTILRVPPIHCIVNTAT